MRVRQLILQDKELREKQGALLAQLQEKEEKIASLEQRVKTAEESYSHLKTARMLELNDNDMRDARRRLSHLANEVDKCIAILKA